MLEKDHLGDWSPDKDFFLTLGIIMSLPSSMVHFVPCDRLLQKAYFNARFKKKDNGYFNESIYDKEMFYNFIFYKVVSFSIILLLSLSYYY